MQINLRTNELKTPVIRKGEGKPMQRTRRIRTLANDESGQALVEYALILMLIALVSVGALTAIGVNVLAILTSVAAGL